MKRSTIINSIIVCLLAFGVLARGGGFLISTASAATTPPQYFQPASGADYRIQNQFSGMVLTAYIGDLYANHWSNDDEIRTWNIIPTGTPGVYYLKVKKGIPWAYVDNGDVKAGAALPASGNDDYYKWEIKRTPLADGRDLGFYSIKNVGSGLYLTFDIDLNKPDLRAENAPINVKPWVGGKTQLWNFYHEVRSALETLSVPQGGWDVNAINKAAVLSRGSVSYSPITCSVSGPQSLSVDAVYWGQYWNGKHFYTVNLNNLTAIGDYTLSCDGKTATFRIDNNIYTNPYRFNGTGRFDITELFDNDYGFVGHWAHLPSWWNKGVDSLPTFMNNGRKELGWRDDICNASGTGQKWAYFSPSIPYTTQMAQNALSGGWDMTDQNWHEWALDGDVLKDLVLFYDEATEPALKNELLEEIAYGAQGILNNQEADGKWRQGVVEGSYWLGTMSKLGGGLAAAARALASSNPTLAAQAENGAELAWSYIYPRRMSRELWSISHEGLYPNGVLMCGWPQSHRHGYGDALLEFAVELYHLNGNSQAKSLIDDIVNRGKINEFVGQLQHASGDRFPGETLDIPVPGAGANYNYKSLRGILALVKYYDDATATQKSRIMDMLRTYYRYEIYDFNNGNKRLNGPVGMFEGNFYGTTAVGGGQWAMPERMLLSGLMYDRFGPEFGRGVLVSERAFDYWTGVNPYASSLILGVGNEFQVAGWSSYFALGRHVGLLPERGTSALYSSPVFVNGYMSRETTAAGGVKMWLGLYLLQRNAASMPKVELFTGSNYSGDKIPLVTGQYLLRHLKAYGLDANKLSSLKVPAGFTVELFDGDNYQGASTTITSDTANLGSMDNRVESIKITYTAPATPPSDPEIVVEGNNQSITDGDTTPSTADGTDFGTVNTSSNHDQVFTIRNTGGNPLSIQSVSVTGSGFSVQAQPASSVAANGTTTFTIRFSASTAGTYTGTVSFGNGDTDENPFNFAITATAADVVTPPSGTNLALNQPASQSSTAYGGSPNRAVDGNTDGYWGSSSVTHTNSEYRPWWEVDLGASQNIASIKLFNRTDCCWDRLSDFYVFVSDTPFGANTDLNAMSSAANWSTHHNGGLSGNSLELNVNASGRYVRVQLAGTNVLNLAEVEVISGGNGNGSGSGGSGGSGSGGSGSGGSGSGGSGSGGSGSGGSGSGVNLALNQPANQSSIAYGGSPSRAVDGNTDGYWGSGSVTHTNSEYRPWWEVDLGASQNIASIKLFNRTDCCWDRLSDFYVFVSDTPFGANTDLNAMSSAANWSTHHSGGLSGNSLELNVNASGRYVRVQLAGTNVLNLAEVEVISGGNGNGGSGSGGSGSGGSGSGGSGSGGSGSGGSGSGGSGSGGSGSQNPVTLGNNAASDGTFVDGYKSNLVVDEASTYTNNSGSTQQVNIDTFNFYARRVADPVTPFVVKVNGDNDFTVLAVGTTRTNYSQGANSFAFADGGASITLNPGESIAVGFLDAYADGTGSGNQSVIPFDGGNQIWYTGGPGGTSGSVSVGAAPTHGPLVYSLYRTYHFNIVIDPQ